MNVITCSPSPLSYGLAPNHRSRLRPLRAVMGPSWTLRNRGRVHPGIAAHKTFIKTGKSVICSGGWALKVHARPI